MAAFLHAARVAAIAALMLLAACGGDSVEDQVRETISAMESAAEEGQLIGFMSHVADDFEGRDGQMQREDFLRFMTLQINRHSRVGAQVFPITVTNDGGNFATATFKVLVTGGRGLLPEDGQVYDVETTWIRDGGDWLLWRADWQPIGR